MQVLVTCGSKRGGTEELAQMLADGLREEGLTVGLFRPEEIKHLDHFDVVIVGGAIYAGRWHKTSRRFVKAHLRELRQRPTYFFSSGPLDDSAARKEIPPVQGVRALMKRVGARGHITFGGRLLPDATGFPARAMAKEHSGDWRDPAQVRSWAKTIAAQLNAG
ncbi:MAG TPA: flavodoxin domain-containing protein [Acidimicrobiales bacterium]|nr:flavodoxin domain-containing protein [Acidimicrobiales bacterium]